MKIYLVDDDENVRLILKILIEKKKLGKVCGTACNGLNALEDLNYVKPDICIVDLLMPLVDGITFVEKAKEKYPDLTFIMLSQVDNKEMISKAYESGITFFIQKPVNSIEVERVLSGVIENIKIKRSFDKVQSLLENGSVLAEETAEKEEKAYVKHLRIILQQLGIFAEGGSSDIITLVEYLVGNEKDAMRISVAELCTKFSPNNSKAMEQRLRRAIGAGLSNLANMGIENYESSNFQKLSNLYTFEQVRKEMDFIRGKSLSRGKVSIKYFLQSLAFECGKK